MLVAFISPKPGSGVSVVATAFALGAAATRADVRLADLKGDAPALLGLPSDPETGLHDWLGVGPDAPTDALDRLAVDAGGGLSLLPAGRRTLASPECGAALAVVLRDDPRLTVADVGTLDTDAARAVAEIADVVLVVVRGCYLALRRGVHEPLLRRAVGAVHVAEPQRSLGAKEIADVLGLRVLTTVPFRPVISRAVDAGILVTRPPEALVRPIGRLLASPVVGLRRDQAA